MDTQALIQSGILTLVGMLVVFLFMGLLIGIMHAFLAIAYRFFPDREKETNEGITASPTDTAGESVAAAISAAILTKVKP